MKEKFRLTKTEKSWILYDIGNSAFTMMVSTLIPIYLKSLAEHSSADYLATWSYALSIATLVGAVLGLILGGLSDHRGWKKPVFMMTVIIGSIACAMLGSAATWIVYMGIFMVARVMYADSLVIYDSMLVDVTSEERMDTVSSYGYAWGYIGSCIPFGAALVLCLKHSALGLSLSAAMQLSFLIVGIWWFVFSLPLAKSYRQRQFASEGGQPVREAFRRIGHTFTKVREYKHVFVFLIAFFFYIDGVYTIIDEASAYGTALNLSTAGLLIALLVTQFVAFPCSIMFGRLAQKHPVPKLITICITAYIFIAVYAVFMQHLYQFFVLAVTVGIFQGGVQSLSRSYFAKMIPGEMSGEYFGLYDICGKGASVVGTFIVGVVTQATGSTNLGVGAVLVVFVIGLVLFRHAVKLVDAAAAGRAGK
jgi:UMF1 family MFS transporter